MSFKEVYNCQQLIAEIKRRPGLYDPTSEHYADKIKKGKLWQEVCEAVVENWRSLDKGERTIKGRDVQKRWKSLRDCFKRELLIHEKMRKSGVNFVKKRKYLYFDNLSFLLPFSYYPRRAESSNTQNISEPTIDNHDCLKDEEENEEEATTSFESIEPHPQRRQIEDDLVYMTSKGDEEVIDDDKAFLFSLLPTIRKFSVEQKFKVRMLMMEVVMQVEKGLNPSLFTYSTAESHQDLKQREIDIKDEIIAE